VTFHRLKQNETIGSYTVASVTQARDQICIIAGNPSVCALVEHHEVVTGALVFTEMHD
jgi:hypothetical protein